MRLVADVSLRSLACALVTFSLLAAPGCVPVPVRVPTQTKDISGKPQQLDFTFLKSGSTTRNEVTKNLAAIDTGVNQNNFFWGRWEQSAWGHAVVGFVPPQPGRYWGTHNLLIEFDQNGTVENWVAMDDKNLDQQLDLFDPIPLIAPLDLSTPLRAKAQWRFGPSNVVLTSENFEYDSGPNYGFGLKTPRTNIRMIASTPGALDSGPFFLRDRFSDDISHANLLAATVYFAKPAVCHYGKKGHFKTKKLEMAIDPPTFLMLRRYIRQTRPNAAPTGAPAGGMNGSTFAPNGKP